MSENTSKKIVLIIGIIIFSFFLYKNIESESLLKNNYDFTIGKTKKFSGRGGTPRYIDFTYFVGSQKFTKSVRRDYDLEDPLNKYYVVKYSKIKPEISEMYLDQEITDSTQIINAGFKYEKK